MKKDIPLSGGLGAQRLKEEKKDLHSNDSIFALKLHSIFRVPNNCHIRNSNHTLKAGLPFVKKENCESLRSVTQAAKIKSPDSFPATGLSAVWTHTHLQHC